MRAFAGYQGTLGTSLGNSNYKPPLSQSSNKGGMVTICESAKEIAVIVEADKMLIALEAAFKISGKSMLN
jgi:hypothetical protein